MTRATYRPPHYGDRYRGRVAVVTGASAGLGAQLCLDLARAGASIIHSDVSVVVVEGNYLLLDREPWNGLAKYFDLTAFLNVPRDELKQRLLDRWLNLGYPRQKAQHWVETNDMPNVDFVLGSRRTADFS